MSSVRDARQHGADILSASGIDTPMLDARVLLAFVLELSSTQLLVADNDLVSAGASSRYLDLIAARATGQPLAYLIGSREFMGLSFQTTPDVLVPRPDTEPLVEWALGWLRSRPHATVADIGTGSGAIAVSIASHSPASWQGKVIATDVSPAALDVATKNADALLTPTRRTRIEFRLGSLASPIHDPVDLLLANLPYLTPEQMLCNPDLRHEPTLALDGGADGLYLVRDLIAQVPRVLRPNGAVGLEIDPGQSYAVQHLLQRALPDATVAIVHDLAGDDRHIVAFSPEG